MVSMHRIILWIQSKSFRLIRIIRHAKCLMTFWDSGLFAIAMIRYWTKILHSSVLLICQAEKL